jgi:RHS repeat-associated protein
MKIKTQIVFTLVSCLAWLAGATQLNAAERSVGSQVQAKPLFPSRLEWIGAQEPPESESMDLLAAIAVFESNGIHPGFAALEDFLQTHATSAWAPSLEVNMAEHYRGRGRYTLALQHWENAWEATKQSPDAKAKQIAVRAVSGWTRLLASLGEKDRANGLLRELQLSGLPLRSYGSVIEGTKGGLVVMDARPGDAYRCGSYALGHVARAIGLDSLVSSNLFHTPSPDRGFRVSQLLSLAAQYGIHITAVRRPAGGEIPVPSVVHWKLDHYAAILEKNGESYKVMDPTFGGHVWMDAATIDAEASGAFLVPETNANRAWARLTSTECANIYGKGYPNAFRDGDDAPSPNLDQGKPDCDPPAPNDGATEDGNGPPPPECGMPTWRISEPYITTWLEDTPIRYRLSSGQWMPLTLTYKHRGEDRGSQIGGFGPKWECNWLGMLVSSGSDMITNHLAGGGVRGFYTNGTPDYHSLQVLTMSVISGARIIDLTGDRGFRNRYEHFMSTLSGVTNHFLTKRLDMYGRTLQRFNYETNGNFTRVVNVVDMDGHTNTIAYGNSTFTNLITAVTNLYGDSAHFTYDHLGRLTNIVDMIGMSSSFQYDSSDTITNMITPYGSTGFEYFASQFSDLATNRAVRITEPTSDKQLYTYRDAGPVSHRNSYHWNRAQYAAISPTGKANVLDMPDADYYKAQQKQWEQQPNGSIGIVTDTLLSDEGPVDPLIGASTRPDVTGLNYQTGMQRISRISRSTSWSPAVDITRNSLGRPVEMTYYNENSTTVSYTNIFDGSGRYLQKVLGPNGETVRGYGYHPVITNLLTSVTNAVGDVTRYTHDTNTMKVTSITFPSGLVRSNIYYSSGTYAGFLQAQIDIGFRTNYFTYDKGNVAVQTNELGLVTTNTWDNLNRLVSTAFPDGTTVSNVYDKLDLRGTKDRNSQWTWNGYNAVRQLIATTNANGQVTQYDYCSCGSPSQITRWNGSTPAVTQFHYDIAGRLTNTTYADGYQINRSYDGNNDLLYLADNAGRGFQLTIERLGLRDGISYVWDTGGAALFLYRTYDGHGRLVTSMDRNGVTVTNAYDLLGRLTARRSTGGSLAAGLESFLYDARGLTNYSDALGKLTSYVRDESGRLRYETNANNEVLQFTYNPADDMLSLTDGKNQTTQWNYDQYGRVTNKVDAASTEIFRYQYDPVGRLTNRWTLAKGNTTYRYDEIGNLTNIVYPTSSSIALRYDGLNRLTNMTDGVGGTAFAWTDADQLASEDGPWANDTVAYTYAGRLRSGLNLSQPNASAWTQSYGYDQWSRLTNVTSAAGSWNMGYPSISSDLLQDLYLPTGAQETRIYDDLRRLTQIYSSNPYENLFYEYNDGSQRTRQTFKDGNYLDYTYDDIGQLKTAKGWESGGTTARPHEQFGYAYDKAWNLNYRTNNALVQTFGVNNLNELTSGSRSGTLTVAGATTMPASSVTVNSQSATLYSDNSFAKDGFTVTNGANTFTAVATDADGRSDTSSVTVNLPASPNYQYDGNGNLLSDGTRAFDYDDENQLIRITVTNAWKSEFSYDGFMRRRVRKEYSWQGAWVQTNEVRYVYDGRVVLQERDVNNLPSVTYTRGNDLSGSLEGAGGIGGLLARTSNSELLTSGANAHAYYHSDGNGNVTSLVNASNVVVARYSYDPFGNILIMSGPLAEANLYRFSSKEAHPNSGLVYYLYRLYDPGVQRWLNRDPLEEYGGINLFEFSATDPLNTVDPFGLRDCPGWAEHMSEHPPSEDTRNFMAISGAVAIPVGLGLMLAPELTVPSAIAAAKAASTATKAAKTANAIGKAEKLAAEAAKAKKEIDRVRKAENALDKLKDIEKAQQKVRKGNLKGKAIDDISKSRQNAKKLLRDIQNDPSCADDL